MCLAFFWIECLSAWRHNDVDICTELESVVGRWWSRCFGCCWAQWLAFVHQSSKFAPYVYSSRREADLKYNRQTASAAGDGCCLAADVTAVVEHTTDADEAVQSPQHSSIRHRHWFPTQCLVAAAAGFSRYRNRTLHRPSVQRDLLLVVDAKDEDW